MDIRRRHTILQAVDTLATTSDEELGELFGAGSPTGLLVCAHYFCWMHSRAITDEHANVLLDKIAGFIPVARDNVG